ncbi:LysR family transcriptional regulator [Pandoraea capi]|uniref:LysR family transcriptional regulator n=1 Tax=Pandoraea capi TaxID=2508286 RepID=A0ABY6VY41_9BURK|nr:LysR family transcriptional regulator [Pandoraea capi]VVD76935.1 LysR family transcriptional regulator [Pandoraea capi]
MEQILSLRALVAVADQGSFSAAARILNVVPSVVTKRINELEASIGAPLFHRTTRSVTTTRLGADHLERARQLLDELDALIGEPSVNAEDIEGRLKLKVPSALGTLRLREAFDTFQRRYPKIDLEIALLDRHISPVEDGFDLAIGVVQHHPGGVVEEVLRPLQRLMCASPDYLARRGTPTHPRELTGHDCMTFFPTQTEWVFEKDGAAVRFAPQPKFTSNDLLLLLSAAVDGNGLTLMPDYVAEQALKAGTLVQVLTDWTVPPGEILAIIPKHRAADHALRALVDVIREALGGHSAQPLDQAADSR